MATASKKINVPDNRAKETVYVPRTGNKDEQDLFVSVNGTNWLLPRGRSHTVPWYVAQEVRRAEAARERYEATSERKRYKA